MKVINTYIVNIDGSLQLMLETIENEFFIKVRGDYEEYYQQIPKDHAGSLMCAEI